MVSFYFGRSRVSIALVGLRLRYNRHMKLHRTTGQPDWATVDPQDYTFWQKIAASTHGYVTPGNITTVCGLTLVTIGLLQLVASEYVAGGIFIVVGRLLDLVDGWLAELTQTKSPLGEVMDAAADKLETLGAIVVLLVVEIAPLWVLLALVVPHLIIAGIAFMGRLWRLQLHPSRIGKISMALLWVVVFGFIGLSVTDNPVAGTAVYATALLTISLTVYATINYGLQLLRRG